MIKNGTYTTDSLPAEVKSKVLETIKNPGVRELLENIGGAKSFSYFFNKVSDRRIEYVIPGIFSELGKTAVMTQGPRADSDSCHFEVTSKDFTVWEGFYLAFESKLTEIQSKFVIDTVAYVLGGAGGWRDHRDFLIGQPLDTLISVNADQTDSQRTSPWYEVNEILEDHLKNGSPILQKGANKGNRTIPAVPLPAYKVIQIRQ